MTKDKPTVTPTYERDITKDATIQSCGVYCKWIPYCNKLNDFNHNIISSACCNDSRFTPCCVFQLNDAFVVEISVIPNGWYNE